jgi:hypothetical protein
MKIPLTIQKQKVIEFHFKLQIFFCGEGPYSRRYGRAAALRLILQPCDENDDDDYFLSFS